MHKQLIVNYVELENDSALPVADKTLLDSARNACNIAYAPYSNFKVGSAAYLANGATICGSNQENVSYPVCMCAEQVLMSNIAMNYPNVKVESIAISYLNADNNGTTPVAPCGQCRQALLEYENRNGHDIKVILGCNTPGSNVIILNCIKDLLPFCFTADVM